MFERGNNHLPTGKLISPSPPPWDDTFTNVIGLPEIVRPGAARLRVWFDSPFLMIYSRDNEGICIEPVTAPPDAQNLGIIGNTYSECLIEFDSDNV